MFRKNRKDGKLLSKLSPFHKIFPYVMKTKTESLVYYNRTFDIDNLCEYISQKNREDNDIRIGIFTVILSAMVRTMALKPHLNRFVKGKRIYARNNLNACFVAKQSMNEDSPETVIKVDFDLHDNIYDVASRIKPKIKQAKQGETKEDDDLITILTKFPRWMIAIFAKFIFFLDYFGKLPKSFTESIPFYSSIFIANLGSIGLDAISHHLYEIGTVSIFMTIGRKRKQIYIDAYGNVKQKKVIDIFFTIDERISEGFYYAKAIELFNKFLQKPQMLENSLFDYVEDEQI